MRTRRPRSARLVAALAIVSFSGLCVWLALGAPGRPLWLSSVPAGARGLLACWDIESSRDSRYPAGQTLCLHPDRVVFWEAGGSVYDGWPVDWSSEGSAFRLSVPTHPGGADGVHFIVAVADGGGLALQSGGGWVDVSLGARSTLRGDDLLDRLAACRACVKNALASSPALANLMDDAPYSLRACLLAARASGGSGCDLGD